MSLILFGPTWLFRFTLKSTFLLYWPMLFVASAPKKRKTEDGDLEWDDTFGRTLKDYVVVLVALVVIAMTLWSIYQPGFHAAYAPRLKSSNSNHFGVGKPLTSPQGA